MKVGEIVHLAQDQPFQAIICTRPPGTDEHETTPDGPHAFESQDIRAQGPENTLTIFITAGPRMTTKSAGKMSSAIGTNILMGAVAAFFSALNLRFRRSVSDVIRRTRLLLVPHFSL